MSVDKKLLKKAQAAHRALQELKASAFEHYGVVGKQMPDSEFTLNWEHKHSAKHLARQALSMAEEASSEHQVFRRGYIFCYSCESAACIHAIQPDPGYVFAGYNSTGTPIWKEFFQVMLSLNDNRTDLLFDAKKPKLLTRVIGRRRLIADQLTSYGKHSLSYKIWGQVIAGYLHVEGIRAAITVQVVETRDHKLNFQLITDSRIHDALVEAPADKRSALHRIHDAVFRARTDINALSIIWQQVRKKSEFKEVENKVFTKLKHLAHSIERKGRQDRRRTVHADVRGQEKRPVHKAREDLLGASEADFFLDRMKQTIVVVGKSGRAHIFNKTGRHITSLIINKDEMERRQQRKRYALMLQDEVDTFKKSAIKNTSQADEKG